MKYLPIGIHRLLSDVVVGTSGGLAETTRKFKEVLVITVYPQLNKKLKFSFVYISTRKLPPSYTIMFQNFVQRTERSNKAKRRLKT